MPDQRVADITELAVLGDQFPMRLMQLGFRLFQAMDESGHDLFQFVVPPVCDVPAGPFLMGSDKQRDPDANENDQHEVFVSAFQIGTYPLTVTEYAFAVDAGAVEIPSTQRGVAWQIRQNHFDHPVVCITWRQAKAYVAWLAQVVNQPWRLPTEAEWEKAARGADGRIYPWGDTWDAARANTGKGGPGTTTPVGSYADKQDASPYGAHDMAGNVHEWTSSIMEWTRSMNEMNWFTEMRATGRFPKRLPYRRERAENDADTTSYRVLRGGAWNDTPRNARAAFRSSSYPDYCNRGLGVRLVLSAATGTS